jgi:hypothetical protein
VRKQFVADLTAGQSDCVIGPLFVAGTGRSGTSQMRQVLGEHPDVHALLWEARFLVDPGGFEDLVRARPPRTRRTTPTTLFAGWPGC